MELEEAARMFNKKALGWNSGGQNVAEIAHDSTSLQMTGGAMLERTVSLSVYVDKGFRHCSHRDV